MRRKLAGPGYGLAAFIGVLLSAPLVAGELQPLIVDLMVNTQTRGEHFAYMDDRGGFFLKSEDLERIAELPADAQSRRIDGDTWIELRTIPNIDVRFNEENLQLDLMLPAHLFALRTYDLTTAPLSKAPEEAVRSALLNYQLAYLGGPDQNDGVWSLATEEALRAGDWLARNQTFHLRGAGAVQSIRFASHLIRDDRANLRRWTIGDAATLPGPLGRSAQLGGLSFEKAYQLQPYLVRRPSLNFSGSVTLPSQVEFYVGDTRVLREQVAPGPFEITDFAYYGGQRDIRVVIRDALGRMQLFYYPYYFADQGLAAGLHDYSYHVGWLREDFGIASDNYGDPAFSGRHEYGWNDRLTLGLHGEGTSDYANLGPSLTLRLDRLGVATASAAGSYEAGIGSGAAASLSHSFQTGPFSTLLFGRNFSRRYAQLRAEPTLDAPRRDFGLSLSYSLGRLGSFNLGYQDSASRNGEAIRSAVLGHSRSLYGRIQLFTHYRHILRNTTAFADTPERGGQFFLGLQYLPDRDLTLSFSAVHRGEAYGSQLQAGNTFYDDEGLGYRITVERERESEHTLVRAAPELRYNARHAALLAQLETTGGTVPSSTRYQLGVAGSVAVLPGSVSLTRPVQDSFAVAEIVPPLADVRVYQNNQEIGRTGADGRLVLPAMTSYINNRIAIDDTDVPIDYRVDHLQRTIAPAFRSGTRVTFPALRLQSFSGRLTYRQAGLVHPLPHQVFSVEVNGVALDFQTGKGGEFYFENLHPGSHNARVPMPDRECSFKLVIPETPEAFVDLEDVVTCDVGH